MNLYPYAGSFQRDKAPIVPRKRGVARLSFVPIAITLCLFVATASAAASTWAVDPSLPGPNRSSVGASLFEEITADGVPFPYKALLSKIERATGCAPRRCTASVLIPLGRSLQRTTAAPDFFRYPRVVTAVTDEGSTQRRMKDRLFLGYQERSGLIEVISYNEAAGRFEFQVVRDYRAGGRPRVVPADRAVCVSCHQNHSAIFSRQQWDETNANPKIAAAIAAQQPRGTTSLHGVAIHGGDHLPNSIDDAADRANLIAVIQRVWRDACDRSCRPAAVAAALQYRLSQGQGFTARPDIAAGFSRVWPEGLAIPEPDLPNRDLPLIAVDVSAEFEALKPRAPRDIWKPSDALLEARFVSGLAALFAESDVDALVSALGKVAAPRRVLRADCSLSREQMTCSGDFAMSATAAVVERLVIDGGELTEILIARGAVTRRGQPARTIAGERIERLELKSAARSTRATLTLVDDFPVLRLALDRTDWSDVFTPDSLRLAVGLKPLWRCCTKPPVAVVPEHRSELPEIAAAFSVACGSCHSGAERSPPNFLAGDAVRIDAALHHCAPRIFVRLAMWQVPQAARKKVPMPPPRAALDGSPHEQVNADAPIGSLQGMVAEWLRSESGTTPIVDEMLAGGYEKLRACMPATN